MGRYEIFKDNIKRILSRGKFGNRKVSVDVLKTTLDLIEENERLTRKLEAIEAISNGIVDRRAA